MNNSVSGEAVVESGKEFCKNLFYFSAKIVEWLSGLFANVGLPLDDIQIKVLIAVVDLGLIYLLFAVAKSLKKPVKFILILLLIYLFIGFWIPKW